MSKDRAHNWWGAAWVEKMERLAEPSRFAEGEQYARSGRVPAIRFDGRTITAKVQGPHEPPYTVRISFDPFSREQWDALLSEVRDRGALASSISSGDLPLEIQTAFSKAQLRFMPERYVDLHLECACPDWLKPCKHIVGVWLKFARDFDHDPFFLFELRGLKRDELRAILRNRRPGLLRSPRKRMRRRNFRTSPFRSNSRLYRPIPKPSGRRPHSPPRLRNRPGGCSWMTTFSRGCKTGRESSLSSTRSTTRSMT
jgi:uncharacterized Zn finger protein